jgi:hypothetical protein
MFKISANTAKDLKSFGNSNSGVNSDVVIRLESGGNPAPGTNSGKIIDDINIKIKNFDIVLLIF